MIAPDAAIQYEAVYNSYELVAKHVRDLVFTQTKEFKIQDIQYRAKSKDSFRRKTVKLNDDGSLKYTDPINQITDLAGVRLICFLKQDVDSICQKILSTFTANDIEDVGERVFQKGRFGYQSKHIIVKLPKSTYLPSCGYINEVTCEIQVRTLLQHAWAEIEHDIQYKGEKVPDYLRKRFAALAGLLEIADGEFERIQQDSESLRSVVEDDLLSRLTVEGFEEEAEGEQASHPESSRSARDLIASGDFSEALHLFDNKIRSEPSAYTLYIGRAKVHFLLGDSSSAIADLNRAEIINPGDVAISNLRDLIESGDVERVKSSSSLKTFSTELIDTANQLIREGKGKEAFAIYSNLEDDGYSKPFSYINKSICCVLETDSNGAREYVSKLKVNIGTPMSVNICIIKYIIDIIESGDKNKALNELAIIISAVPHFSIEMSPISNLLEGLKRRNRPLYSSVFKDLAKVPQISMRKKSKF